MKTWLYPISKRAGAFFHLDDGTRWKVSAENYEKLVENGRLGEDEEWTVSKNFRNAQTGDEVFIYTGDEDRGIIGYARILAIKSGANGHVFHLNFDLGKCAVLLANPIPAPLVRTWVKPLRGAVENLTPYLPKLRELLLYWFSLNWAHTQFS